MIKLTCFRNSKPDAGSKVACQFSRAGRACRVPYTHFRQQVLWITGRLSEKHVYVSNILLSLDIFIEKTGSRETSLLSYRRRVACLLGDKQGEGTWFVNHTGADREPVLSCNHGGTAKGCLFYLFVDSMAGLLILAVYIITEEMRQQRP